MSQETWGWLGFVKELEMNIILKCGNAKHRLEIAACIIELVKYGSLTHGSDNTVLKISGDNFTVIFIVADINEEIDMSQVGKSMVIVDNNFCVPMIRAKSILDKIGVSFTE